MTRALAASPHLAHDDQPVRAKAKNGTTPYSIVTSTTIAACEGKLDAVSQLSAIADHNTAPSERGHRMPSAGLWPLPKDVW